MAPGDTTVGSTPRCRHPSNATTGRIGWHAPALCRLKGMIQNGSQALPVAATGGEIGCFLRPLLWRPPRSLLAHGFLARHHRRLPFVTNRCGHPVARPIRPIAAPHRHQSPSSVVEHPVHVAARNHRRLSPISSVGSGPHLARLSPSANLHSVRFSPHCMRRTRNYWLQPKLRESLPYGPYRAFFMGDTGWHASRALRPRQPGICTWVMPIRPS